METRQLYYEDCHLQSFSAKVTGCVERPKGYEITLDATAFFPEGGGQACDMGMLGDVRVLDVHERAETVIHLCDGPLEIGAQVEGCIDYKRRFDQMQQHTGEHIVSGIIHRMFGYHNVGFHVGGTMVTIDFDGMIPPESLAQIELGANEAIWKNLPVRTWVPSPEELSELTYRSKRALPWPVRIVEVPGFDDCACCGVHVSHTGEVGLIKLCSMVKFHQGVRIEMVCGNRALQYLCAVYEQNRQVSQAFSAKLLETGEAARRMNEILAAEKYRAEGLQIKVFTEIAKGYVNQKHVLHFEQGLNPGSVRELADRIAAVCSGTAAVFSGSEEAGYSFCLMTRQGDLRQLGREMTTALHGRGGGKAEFQQGSVKAGREEITAFFESRF